MHSHIGFGSPVQDSPKAHGEPLGSDAVRATKQFLGLSPDVEFAVPAAVPQHIANGLGARGRTARHAWESRLDHYRLAHPEEADELDRLQRRLLPADWASDLPTFEPDPVGAGTRISSGHVLNAVAERVPWLLGGAADLAPSTKTRLEFGGSGDLQPATPGGRNVHFGVREHAAAAIANGTPSRRDTARQRVRGAARPRRTRGTRGGEHPRPRGIHALLGDLRPSAGCVPQRGAPPHITARVGIEQASTFGWDRWVGEHGAVIGMHTFGASAPLKQLLDTFGFTPDKVSETARNIVHRARNETKEAQR